MKKIIIVIIVLVNFSFTQILSGQNAKEICAKYVEHLGGSANIDKIKNVSTEQVGYANNFEIPQSIIIVKGKSFYQSTNYPNGKSIVALTDNKGWETNPYSNPKTHDLSTKELAVYGANLSIFGPLYDFYLKGDSSIVKEVSYEGDQKVDNDLCYKIKVLYKTEFVEFVYISQKSFMMRKVENKMGEVSYSNFKKVNDVFFPFNSEIKNKLGVMTVDVTNLKTNIEVSPKLFEKSQS